MSGAFGANSRLGLQYLQVKPGRSADVNRWVAVNLSKSQKMKSDIMKPSVPDCYWILILVALLASGCRSSNDTPVNLPQSLVSPSGRYILKMRIEEHEVNPDYSGTQVWKVTILDSEDQVVYKDDGSEFVGSLMVYWLWDAEDRVWLYNSDTGEVYFWELMNQAWVKTKWGAGKEREIDREIVPPTELYPPYVQ